MARVARGRVQHETVPPDVAHSTIGKPAPPGLASYITGFHPLLEQRWRAESLAIGFVQNLVNLKAEAGRRHVHQLEGTDRVPEPELAGGIDVFGRCHAFVDETNRLDDEGVKDTVHRETDHVLDTDRCFAGCAAEPHRRLDRLLGRLETGDYLNELHARHRRKIM